jgi:hypothetical protein
MLVAVLARATHARACILSSAGPSEVHVVQLEKCLAAALAAEAAPGVCGISPRAASDFPRVQNSERKGVSGFQSATAAPYSTLSSSAVAAQLSTMLALSLPSSAAVRRRDLFDQALCLHPKPRRHCPDDPLMPTPPSFSATLETVFPLFHPDIAAAVVHSASAAGTEIQSCCGCVLFLSSYLYQAMSATSYESVTCACVLLLYTKVSSIAAASTAATAAATTAATTAAAYTRIGFIASFRSSRH